MLNTKFTPFPILTTEKLTLRQLSTSDEQEIFNLRSDAEVSKYLGRPLCTSIVDARNFITKVNENVDKNLAVYWAIILNNKGMLAGTICLFGFSEEDKKCEIGYELLTKFQGQGIMKESIQRVVDYAFNTIEVQKIEAFVHKDNRNSLTLLEKLSFCNATDAENTNPELLCFALTN